jgi:FMN phosphatase YigB (HAD superfamily)
MKKRAIIFDLDYTLFDARKFKNYLAKVLEISVRKFNNEYEEYFVKTKTNYSLAKHLAILQQRKELKNIKEIKSNLQALWEEMDRFLYPGAEDLLVSLVEKKYILYLVTCGNKTWQKKKINHLKIKKYFTEVFFSDKDKSGIFKKFKKYKDLAVVNDNASEIMKIKKILPLARFYLIRGPYSSIIKHELLTVNLRQINKIYEKNSHTCSRQGQAHGR